MRKDRQWELVDNGVYQNNTIKMTDIRGRKINEN